jgi:hypothetical protein
MGSKNMLPHISKLSNGSLLKGRMEGRGYSSALYDKQTDDKKFV